MIPPCPGMRSSKSYDREKAQGNIGQQLAKYNNTVVDSVVSVDIEAKHHISHCMFKCTYTHLNMQCEGVRVYSVEAVHCICSWGTVTQQQQ